MILIGMIYGFGTPKDSGAETGGAIRCLVGRGAPSCSEALEHFGVRGLTKVLIPLSNSSEERRLF